MAGRLAPAVDDAPGGTISAIRASQIGNGDATAEAMAADVLSDFRAWTAAAHRTVAR